MAVTGKSSGSAVANKEIAGRGLQEIAKNENRPTQVENIP